MSGDVQPRKRKDKKRKKDELGLEEHRGTAATFGEGDVQMHSQHDHGTGGHWCAKIIFFSLLAVLVTLIGLIILENRGLSELEANAVESQYSGILEGWIEDTPDDDHHDEHTLDLKHHDHNEDVDELGFENDHELEENVDSDEHGDGHDEEFEHDDGDNDEGDDDESKDREEDEDDEEGDMDEDDTDEDENVSKEIEDDDNDDIDDDDDTPEDEDNIEQENDNDSNEDEDGEIEEMNIRRTTENSYAKPDYHDDDDEDDDDDDDDDNENNEKTEEEETGDLENEDDRDDDSYDDNSNEIADNSDDNDDDDVQSVDNDNDGDENSKEEQDDEDDDEHEEDHEEEADEEIEKIEKEVSDQDETESAELALPDDSVEKEEETSVEVVSPDEEYEVDEKVFLEVDDLDEPEVERIAPPPPGKPYVEIDEEVSTETQSDALAEEEEYEKQQEELRQQQAQSTQMWLKLVVGGALLAATHAVIRRATAPRDAPESEQDEHDSREETPLSDRRMTLIPEETSKVIPPQSLQPKFEEEIIQKVSSVVKAAAVQKQESEEVEEDVAVDEEVEEDQEVQVKKTDEKDKELYSDEDEVEVDEEVDDEEEIEEKKEVPKSILKVAATKKEPEPEPEEVPDDVEIIDEEQIEEEVEEEVEDEEEISDVDDAELLSRLEAKYGRLPEPERPGPKHKDGGNSVEDDWPGEPSEPYWREQLEKAEQELRQGAYAACEERASAARLADSGRAQWLRARALDQLAEERRDNRVLGRAITAYKRLLEMNERLSDKKVLEVALRTIDRIQFRGTYLNAEPVYKLLIRRFPNEVSYRNNLTISFLMANRADLAIEVLKETLRLWPDDRVALAHYGFVLKTEQNKVEESVTYFQRALKGDTGPANEPRFYYHLGDALLLLGRKVEAHEVHKRGAALGHFLSPSQRSLYNVPRLKSQPWWDVEITPYAKLARELEASWREILKEGEAAQALYESEKEGLRERGEWSQLDLFVRGREVPGRCERAPVTCRIVKREPAAQCRRGQVKFSLLSGGSHVRAHVGPTNCRLRMHLALSNTEHTFLRVDHETRSWQVGKVLMFDDSFEHEVWHNGTRARLVLIVDVWHPALSDRERRALPAI